MDSQKKLMNGSPTQNRPGGVGRGGTGYGGNLRLAQVLCWNCWDYGHHVGGCRDEIRNDEARE